MRTPVGTDQASLLATAAGEPVSVAHGLGWTLEHVATVYGISARACAVLRADGNLLDVVFQRYSGNPDRLASLLARLARGAGGAEALRELSVWAPSSATTADDELEPDTQPAAPPPRAWRAALGWAPSRYQVLEEQVAHAREELEPCATVEQLADRIAVCPGDTEFLEVLCAGLDATVMEEP